MALIMAACLMPRVSFAAEEVYLTRGVANYGSYISGDRYHARETEHFQILWGDEGESNKVTEEFLKNCETVFENCWDKFVIEMGMTPPTTNKTNKSVNYKINAVLMNTGVEGYGEGWAYGGMDAEGYPYFMCDVDAMTDGVVPHEMGHVMHFAQGDNAWENNNYLGPWYEAIGNWFREQYWYDENIYSNEADFRTDLSALYLRATALTATNGRAYYEAWPILQYLTDNPENTPGYGKNFVAKLLNYRPANLQTTFYEVLNACKDPSVSLEDTIGAFASHMAAMDFAMKENYNKKINKMYIEGSLFPQQRYTIAEKYGESENTYTVPYERYPQAMGYNIIPLSGAGKIAATLEGLTDIPGAAWRARLIKEDMSGNVSYSPLFGAGETQTISAETSDKVYLSVAATPEISTMQKYGVGGWTPEFAEANIPFESKNTYPYAFTLENAEINTNIRENPLKYAVSGAPHPNGGGFVARTAHVDASVYVGPNAAVIMNARVTGGARIEGNAYVGGAAQVSGNARIGGNAVIYGSAQVSGNAYVGGNAVVTGEATVSGNARVAESAFLAGYYNVTDNAIIKGQAMLYGGYYDANGKVHGNAEGFAIAYGDFFEDENKTIAGGAFSGYHSLTSQTQTGYVSENNGKYSRGYVPYLAADYEFENGFSELAGSGGYGVDGACVKDGYASFDGNQYAVLSKTPFLYDEMTVSLKMRGKSGEVLSIGGGIALSSDEGFPCLTVNGTKITLDRAFTGDWQEVLVTIGGGEASLSVDGVKKSAKAEKEAFSENDSVYLGRGFDGDVDYLRVFTSENTDEYTPEGLTKVFEGGFDAWTASGGASFTEDTITVSSQSAATITSPGYGKDVFVIEFEPSGDKIYPDHAFFDKSGKIIFAHRYASDANAIYTGRGEMSFCGSDFVTDTAAQKRLSNFAAERVLESSTRSDRGAASYTSESVIRIIAENTVMTQDLREEFEGAVNVSAANLSSVKDGDAVYTVNYEVIENSLTRPVSRTLYIGGFNGFGGIKTYNPSQSGSVVRYGGFTVYSDAVPKISAENGEVGLENCDEGGIVIFALYDKDVLTKIYTKAVSAGEKVVVPEGFENAKVMFFKNLTILKPMAESINL